MSNIVISFDGTWNTPKNDSEGDDSTNVWKFHKSVELDEKYKHYEKGVGTEWYNHLRGGIFAVGLSKTIQSSYKYLVNTYKDGDKIYILGFSRGAYAARSLVGLIRNIGLLQVENEDRISEAYELYRMRDDGPDSENAKFFRNKYSKNISIHFLGVWDTVGKLGVPVESFNWFNKYFYQFHDTELSGIVKNGYHAVAIDEHRECYPPTLWDPKVKPNQKIEQAWFSGAHSNIGGGYKNNKLSELPLSWMIEKAKKSGLKFKNNLVFSNKAVFDDKEYTITDSYKEFLTGLYCNFSGRYYRNIGETSYGNESIHDSTKDRVSTDKNYLPKNIVQEKVIDINKKGVGRLQDIL